MPTYEYRCLDCGFKFEAFQKMTDEPIRVCTECGGRTERIISGGTGLIFKGSGFYITDYKSKGKPPEPKRPKIEKKTDAKKEKTKTEK